MVGTKMAMPKTTDNRNRVRMSALESGPVGTNSDYPIGPVKASGTSEKRGDGHGCGLRPTLAVVANRLLSCGIPPKAFHQLFCNALKRIQAPHRTFRR